MLIPKNSSKLPLKKRLFGIMRMKRSSSGMTLIELIMLIAIGSIIVGGVVMFVRELTVSQTRMRDRLLALDLAQMQMESLMNSPYDSLADGTVSVFYGFKVKQTVTETASVTQTYTAPNVTLTYAVKKISLTADYESGDFSKPLFQLTTYRQSNTMLDTINS